MNSYQLFLANLHNLTAMWRALGADRTILADGCQQYRSQGWPDRLWFDADETPSANDRAALIATATTSPRELIVPTWNAATAVATQSPWPTELRLAGLRSNLRTIVMDADIKTLAWKTLTVPDLDYADGKGDVALWSDVASRSFGYAVDYHMVENLAACENAHVILAYKEGAAVATGLLFVTGSVAGLHMLGVAPEARRQGIAGAVMMHLLEAARERGLQHAALQASTMGEGLYRKLGFAPSGHVDWFRRNPTTNEETA
jgi:GNAT superfamily N-acetyltransferase